MVTLSIYTVRMGCMHYENTPMQYTAILHRSVKLNDKLQSKKKYIFLIFAQNIDRGYTLEPVRVISVPFDDKPKSPRKSTAIIFL